MSFEYQYTVQFRDTDAAGVGYFASIISICHVAYEASLIKLGIDLKLFVNNPNFAVPITHVSADFHQPLFCGDRLIIELTPRLIDSCQFEINYQILARSDSALKLATVVTKHVAIDPAIRKRQDLPALLQNWLVRWG
jgi:1,4-dihydroxy-2-naphthoyl-CoA hydrolase